MLLVFMLSIKLFCFSLFFLEKKNMQSGLCNKCKQEFEENDFIYTIIRKVTSFHLEEWKSDVKEKHLE